MKLFFVSLFIFTMFLFCPVTIQAIDWEKQAVEDAKQDKIVIAFNKDQMTGDQVPRILPDGRIALYFMTGGYTEPAPENHIAVVYSNDNGDTWTSGETLNLGIPRSGNTIGQLPTEALVLGNKITLFFSTHAGHLERSWQSWMATTNDNGKTWDKPQLLPGRLAAATFIRAHIITRDKRILLPFQHNIGNLKDPNGDVVARNRDNPNAYPTPITNTRNGVLISKDEGQTWSEHGNIRLPIPENTHLWAENAIVEPTKDRIVMLIRPEWWGGTLYKAESSDGGLTWPEVAEKTEIPNPSSKISLYLIAENTVALLHNPNPKHRSPLSLWISFDGMKTWAYKRVVIAESYAGPKANLNYPEGYVTSDKQWLHFSIDDNRRRALFVRAKLPPLPKTAE
ncbi:MAG: glycoside hydrolase [Planctomycetaceae bacterium]|jgi:hypothetical protein|nr:glycoside hydrolase [Planctomycetaceae bacterium]